MRLADLLLDMFSLQEPQCSAQEHARSRLP